MTTTFKIIGKTNPWIAQRDSLFCGKTEIIIEKGLTLKEARTTLLKLFNNDYDLSCPNMGSAMNSKEGRDHLSHYNDGTYSYDWDSRTYAIEVEEPWTYCYIVEKNGAPVESGKVTFKYEEEEKEFIERMTDRYEEDFEDCVEVLFR